MEGETLFTNGFTENQTAENENVFFFIQQSMIDEMKEMHQKRFLVIHYRCKLLPTQKHSFEIAVTLEH